MAIKVSVVVIYLVIILLHLLMENHATSLTEEANYLVVSQHKAHGDLIIPQAPTPQPQQNYSHFPVHGITEGSLQPQECGPRCTGRCSKTAYKKPCMFFCQKCCAKCLCVPPGTYGNKQFCPCYNNWKTKRGGPKCP